MDRLRKTLNRIDGKGYKAYKDIQGSYQGNGYTLHMDYVQGDPFAAPSRLRVEIPQDRAQCSPEWFDAPPRQVALEDFLAREVSRAIAGYNKDIQGSGKSGLISIDTPGQEVLERTAVVVDKKKVEVRLTVGLPARGRRILGRQAEQLLCQAIPSVVDKGIMQRHESKLIKHLELMDQQQAIRQYLKENNLVTFIANGSVLPRQSGVSNRPLQSKNLVPFESPPSMEVEIDLPHRGPIRGMAISRGVTLVVGGGYHGKSTLLNAVERGVYHHIAGDGREYVITDDTAFKIRAEDGRRVEKVNISPFINDLPFGQETQRFSSDDASGSTSQAANIMEALEVESDVLLIDEDTSATNFMIRDARMQELVAQGKEPITPFIDKVKQVYDDKGVSTILVIGGSGDYFDVADQVVMMDEYRPYEVTAQAKEIAGKLDNLRKEEGGEAFGNATPRKLKPSSFDARRGKKEKVDAKSLYKIVYGRTDLELRFVEQLVDASQTRAIANMLRFIDKKSSREEKTVAQWLDDIYARIEKEGLDVLSPFRDQHPGDMALPRRFELAAALNRLRTLSVE